MTTSTHGDSTKRLMIQSLKQLMTKKNLNKISIKEITQLCDLNRQTFYYHFEDIYDMLKWMYQDEVISLVAQHQETGRWQDGLLYLFKYIEENKVICLCAFNSLGHQYLRHFFHENAHATVHKLITTYLENSSLKIDTLTLTQLTHYYTTASASMIESWLLGEMTQTPEEMVSFIEIIITDQLTGALLRQKSCSTS